MAPIDLIYRREVHGISRRKLADLLGRSYPTVVKWEQEMASQPPWLAEWLEYMDMELICGRTPVRAPKRLPDMEAILRPDSVTARRNAREAKIAAKRQASEKRAKERLLREERHKNHVKMALNRRKQGPWA